MTQKEILYIEDAIGHEKNIQDILTDNEKNIQDQTLQEFIRQEIKQHKKNETALKKRLEENS